MFAGYVLAGGGSSRFGSDKALVEFGSVTVAPHCTICEKLHEPGCVRCSRLPEIPTTRNVTTVDDRWPGEGPLGGIVTALQYSRRTTRPLPNGI